MRGRVIGKMRFVRVRPKTKDWGGGGDKGWRDAFSESLSLRLVLGFRYVCVCGQRERGERER